jgi:hypothetical protein
LEPVKWAGAWVGLHDFRDLVLVELYWE